MLKPKLEHAVVFLFRFRSDDFPSRSFLEGIGLRIIVLESSIEKQFRRVFTCPRSVQLCAFTTGRFEREDDVVADMVTYLRDTKDYVRNCTSV
jgi:hypothetical protein